MEEKTYNCLGQHPSIILEYTTQQAENCPKYQDKTGLCAGGGICTVMFQTNKNNPSTKKDLENIF